MVAACERLAHVGVAGDPPLAPRGARRHRIAAHGHRRAAGRCRRRGPQRVAAPRRCRRPPSPRAVCAADPGQLDPDARSCCRPARARRRPPRARTGSRCRRVDAVVRRDLRRGAREPARADPAQRRRARAISIVWITIVSIAAPVARGSRSGSRRTGTTRRTSRSGDGAAGVRSIGRRLRGCHA